jgi:hypothetical protein
LLGHFRQDLGANKGDVICKYLDQRILCPVMGLEAWEISLTDQTGELWCTEYTATIWLDYFADVYLFVISPELLVLIVSPCSCNLL